MIEYAILIVMVISTIGFGWLWLIEQIADVTTISSLPAEAEKLVAPEAKSVAPSWSDGRIS